MTHANSTTPGDFTYVAHPIDAPRGDRSRDLRLGRNPSYRALRERLLRERADLIAQGFTPRIFSTRLIGA